MEDEKDKEMMRDVKVTQVQNFLGCGMKLAKELLILADWDVSLVRNCAVEGGEISLTKANIINERIRKIAR